MFLDFFLLLKNRGIPVSITEYLNLLEALKRKVIDTDVDSFYFLCRTTLVKDERFVDEFDKLFGLYFQGMEFIPDELIYSIPESWLAQNGSRLFSKEEMEQIKAMGGLENLLERIQELLKEQKERHQGGGKWIGTGGVSPFGAYGYNPEGIRIGQHESRYRRAVKVWDERQFKNLREDVNLETRNLKVALKGLRKMTREGGEEQLDLEETIRKTSDHAGLLQLHMRRVKKNNAKVLLLMDVGGSMDDHIELCSQLFSAARYEFKHLEFFYFHNCVYENLWKDNTRRQTEPLSTFDVLHRYNQDYYLILVGDAAMSPYEIMSPYGSVEHYNEEAGVVWLERLKQHFPKLVWLNPEEEARWNFSQSTQLIQEILNQRMYPLTVQGIGRAIDSLMKK